MNNGIPEWWPADTPWIISDCRPIMKEMPPNSVDAIITDPPYELGFMGKKWDSTGIAYDVEMWEQGFRVLKPGGHLLSFGGSRTYHRMACAIEDAGFVIRDQIMWVYGSGFPKSLNIGKAVDKLQGNERDVIGKGFGTSIVHKNKINKEQGYRPNDYYEDNEGEFEVTKGISEWEGWGTALKPAHEPIVLARKPLSEKTVAENVLKWGTGGINIDGCRVPLGNEKQPTGSAKRVFAKNQFTDEKNYGDNKQTPEQGRFPANFIHDGSQMVLDLFPDSKSQSGLMKPGTKTALGQGSGYNKHNNKEREFEGYGDSGSAARFFYCAKASKSERNAGLEALEEKNCPHGSYVGRDLSNPKVHLGGLQGGRAKNFHPTVKPIALMEYLIRLVTMPGYVVLDPFLGSGTTLVACRNLNRIGIGCEIEEKNENIIRGRIKERIKQPIRPDHFVTPTPIHGQAILAHQETVVEGAAGVEEKGVL